MIAKEVQALIDSRLSELEDKAHVLLDSRHDTMRRLRILRHKITLVRRAAAGWM